MTIPISPVNVQPPFVPNNSAQLLQALLGGLESSQRAAELSQRREALKLEQKRLAAADAEHEAAQRENAQLGEAVRGLLLSMTQPQAPLPPGALPPGAASPTPSAVPPAAAYGQFLQQLPPSQVLAGVTAVAPMRQAQEAQATDAAAYKLFTENLPTIGGDIQGWQKVLAGVQDPNVGARLLQHVMNVVTLQGKGADVTGQNLGNVVTATTLEQDKQIQGVLAGLESQPWNRQTIGQAITRVAAISPARATQVAQSLGQLIPDYSPRINPSGSVSWVPKQPGGVTGAPIEAEMTDTQRKTAGFARRVFEANATMTNLEKRFPNIGQQVDDWIRTLRTGGQLPAVGRSLETLFTPTIMRLGVAKSGIPGVALREYVNARYDLGNAILRNVSGATINMEELDREILPYVPMLGMANDVLPSIQQRRLELARSYAEQAANAFNPNTLSPLARRYYLASIVPEQPPAPVRSGPIGTTLTPRP
jgi:hypothetical protein